MLSFLPPSQEAGLGRATVESARRLAPQARARARAAFLSAAARPPAAPDAGGASLRTATPWWFHPASARDGESDPAFNLTLAAFAVKEAAAARGLRAVTLCGAPPGLAEALAPCLEVTEVSPAPRRPAAFLILRALAARAAACARLLRETAAASAARTPEGRFDALLVSFWDWGAWSGAAGVEDRYYKALPGELRARGLRTGWLLWYESGPVPPREETLVLQSLLSLPEVLAAFLDFGPLCAYLRWRRRPDLASLYAAEGLDLRPLLEPGLLRGFLDGSLPRAACAALAAERAVRALSPRLIVCFLEHHPFTRALTAGARRAGRPFWAAVQHASYSSEKTFHRLEPETDFKGLPDGRPAPAPDAVLAMGALGARLFGACGYPEGRVVVTGSPRYDHLAEGGAAPGAPLGRPARLLAVSTLDTAGDIDMAEALAAAVRAGAPAELRLREHPFSRLAGHPRFPPLAPAFSISPASLAEDLAWADAVVFTYSTVAEEAVLAGKPVWQWLPLGYNASALAEVLPIPGFSSPAELAGAVARLRADPAAAAPSPADRARVVSELFHRADGGAARRCADALLSFLIG